MSLRLFSPRPAPAKVSISFTEAARQKAEQDMVRHQSSGLQLVAELAGCEGFRHTLQPVNAPAKSDLCITISDTLALYVSPRCTSMVDGLIIDVVPTQDGATYTFDNPNSVGSCDCGKNDS